MSARLSNRSAACCVSNIQARFESAQDYDRPDLRTADQNRPLQSEDLGREKYLQLNSQLHPWLVPHSVQTPHAPARITLSLPHTEQVIPMKMLPSATVTRSV